MIRPYYSECPLDKNPVEFSCSNCIHFKGFVRDRKTGLKCVDCKK